MKRMNASYLVSIDLVNKELLVISVFTLVLESCIIHCWVASFVLVLFPESTGKLRFGWYCLIWVMCIYSG